MHGLTNEGGQLTMIIFSHEYWCTGGSYIAKILFNYTIKYKREIKLLLIWLYGHQYVLLKADIKLFIYH